MEGALDLSSKATSSNCGITNSPHEIINSLSNETTNASTCEAPSPPMVDTHSLDVNLSSSLLANKPGETGACFPNTRPFKMYPFEPLTGLYSQLATQATTLANSGLYPFASTGLTPPPGAFGTPRAGLTNSGYLGNAMPITSTPIDQYSQQKKRRIDSRSSSRDGRDVSHETSLSKITIGDVNDDTTKRPENENDIVAKNAIMAEMLANKSTPVTRDYRASEDTPAFSDNDCNSLQINEEKNLNSLINNKIEQALSEHTSEPLQHQVNSNISSIQNQQDNSNELDYWDRRRKNNMAAKRSRDARRVKEEEIAIRAAFLEQENLKLRAQVAILKNETNKLHFMLYNH